MACVDTTKESRGDSGVILIALPDLSSRTAPFGGCGGASSEPCFTLPNSSLQRPFLCAPSLTLTLNSIPSDIIPILASIFQFKKRKKHTHTQVFPYSIKMCHHGAHQRNMLPALKAAPKAASGMFWAQALSCWNMHAASRGDFFEETALISMCKFWCVHLKDQSESFIRIQ